MIKKLKKEDEILKNKLNISLSKNVMSKKFEKIAKRPNSTIEESEFEEPPTKFNENKFPKKITTKSNLKTIEESKDEIPIPPIRRKHNVREMIKD